MIIYLITNKLNGKQYVGQTVRSLDERLREHRRSKKSLGGKAFKKYGKDAFVTEILHETYDIVELNRLEAYEIAQRNTLAPKGYNIASGGDGTLGYRHSKEAKDKMSKARKGKYSGKDNPFFGKQHTEETKNHLSQLKKGKYIHEGKDVKFHTVKVLNVTTGEIFDSIKDAALSCDAKPTHITRVCKGRRKSTRGYVWSYL